MKNVLFITYFWPPSGKASLHWPLDIINYLPEDKIRPIILTVEEESSTQKDLSLLAKVKPGWAIIKSKALEPFDIYRKFIGKKKNEIIVPSEAISTSNKSLAHRIALWIRLNLFVPDARVGWYFTAVKAAKKYIKLNTVDAIVSIGPPHSAHLIGLTLSRKFSIPHIPVLIDPWTNIVYYKNLKRNIAAVKLDNYLEKSVLKNSEHTIFVTKTTLQDYNTKYPFLSGKSFVLYWGYDEKAFESLPVTIDNSEEIILHAGNIFDYQNPVNFWKTLKRQIDKGKQLKLKFIGTVGEKIKDEIKNNGLLPHTEFQGFLPYLEMLKELMKAKYLLVCASEPRHVPGKLFEYLRTGKPIIAFGENNAEVKDILQKANAGMIFRYDDDCEEFFNSVDNFSTNISYVKEFNRKSIAYSFKNILLK